MNARREKVKTQHQLNRQLEPVEKPRRERDEFTIEVGKFFLDLAKLTFGGMFLTAIMDVSYDMEKVIKICSMAILILAVIGFIFIKLGNNKK